MERVLESLTSNLPMTKSTDEKPNGAESPELLSAAASSATAAMNAAAVAAQMFPHMQPRHQIPGLGGLPRMDHFHSGNVQAAAAANGAAALAMFPSFHQFRGLK